MSFIVPEEIEAYAEAHTTPPAPLLAELAEETKATLESPQMLTGPIEVPERTSYWVRRELDDEVTIEEAPSAAPAAAAPSEAREPHGSNEREV